MNSGMYSALSGSIVSQQRLEILTNNLANANTPGFKRDRLVFESVLTSVKNSSPSVAPLTDAPVTSGVTFATDYTAGPVKQTGNTLDLALDGNGFFVVNTPQGKAYTRQGNFRLDSGNRLVTADGYEVLGNGKPIVVTGGRAEIGAKGEVLVAGNRVATLDIADFPQPYALQKAGNALFVPDGGGSGERPARDATVKQGYLEDSNVNPILEMAQLIETNRYYESCLKAVRSYDDMAAKAANDLGKV